MRRWVFLAGFFWGSAMPAWAHLHVMASTTDLAAIAQEIGKDQIDVISLLPPDADPHQLPADLPDAPRLRNADLVMVIGLEYEAKVAFTALLKKYGRGRFSPDSAAYFDASDGCEILEKPDESA